jgi:hypothetical protein
MIEIGIFVWCVLIAVMLVVVAISAEPDRMPAIVAAPYNPRLGVGLLALHFFVTTVYKASINTRPFHARGDVKWCAPEFV